jgi:serine/threonine protein phosphatase PrpC
MSILKPNRQLFGWAQQIGASTPHETQQDRIRIEFVHTNGGKKVLLAVVADGEHHPDAGKTAEHIVNHIFNQFKRLHGNDFNQRLAHAFETAGKSIRGKGGQVAATAIAIYRNRLYFAHSGHTAGFLIRGGYMNALTRPHTILLGIPSVEIQRGDEGGLRLHPGDQILLTTDGLLRVNPEDGRLFVDPKNIPAHIEGNSPDDASRHLVSLAMGRDVDDNVTVALLQVPGEKGRPLRLWRWLALIVAVPIVFTLLRFIPSLHREESLPPVTDYGYAVLIEGSVLVETDNGDTTPTQRLEAIGPRSWILAQENSRFALQSNAESSYELSSASIYVSRGSRGVFSLVDAGIHLPEELENLSHRTIVKIDSGAIFIQRDAGSRTYQVDLSNNSVSLTGDGHGAMGISTSSSGTEVDCLLGTCEVISKENESVVLKAGSSLIVIQGSLGEEKPTPAQRTANWIELCGNCFPDESHHP